MKPETERALIALNDAAKREVIILLAKNMDPVAFAEAFYDEDGDPTTEGLAIIDQVASDDEPDKESIRDEVLSELVSDADILHEAICEGRKQDAIDILNTIIPGASLRPVKAQNSLFPQRVQVDL